MANDIDAVFESKWKELSKPAEYCGVGVSIIDKEEARKLFHHAATKELREAFIDGGIIGKNYELPNGHGWSFGQYMQHHWQERVAKKAAVSS